MSDERMDTLTCLERGFSGEETAKALPSPSAASAGCASAIAAAMSAAGLVTTVCSERTDMANESE